MPNEVWKSGCFRKDLLIICNNTYEAVSGAWHRNRIFPRSKKENLVLLPTIKTSH